MMEVDVMDGEDIVLYEPIDRDKVRAQIFEVRELWVVAVFVSKCYVLSLILPLYRPASLLHTGYKLFAAGRLIVWK